MTQRAAVDRRRQPEPWEALDGPYWWLGDVYGEILMRHPADEAKLQGMPAERRTGGDCIIANALIKRHICLLIETAMQRIPAH